MKVRRTRRVDDFFADRFESGRGESPVVSATVKWAGNFLLILGGKSAGLVFFKCFNRGCGCGESSGLNGLGKGGKGRGGTDGRCEGNLCLAKSAHHRYWNSSCPIRERGMRGKKKRGLNSWNVPIFLALVLAARDPVSLIFCLVCL